MFELLELMFKLVRLMFANICVSELLAKTKKNDFALICQGKKRVRQTNLQESSSSYFCTHPQKNSDSEASAKDSLDPFSGSRNH